MSLFWKALPPGRSLWPFSWWILQPPHAPYLPVLLPFPGSSAGLPKNPQSPSIYNPKPNAVHHDWLWVSFAIIKDSENVFSLKVVKSSAAPGPWQQSVIDKEWKMLLFPFHDVYLCLWRKKERGEFIWDMNHNSYQWQTRSQSLLGGRSRYRYSRLLSDVLFYHIT